MKKVCIFIAITSCLLVVIILFSSVIKNLIFDDIEDASIDTTVNYRSKISDNNQNIVEKTGRNEILYLNNIGQIKYYDINSKATGVVHQEVTKISDIVYSQFSNCFYLVETTNMNYSLIKTSENMEMTLKVSTENISSIACIKERIYYISDQKLYYMDSPYDKEIYLFDVMDYSEIFSFDDQKLYYQKKDGTWAYYDGTDSYDIPLKRDIENGNKDFILCYDNNSDEIVIYDSNSWEIKHNIKIEENAYETLLNPDATKVIYCVILPEDLLAGNTDAFYNFVEVDLVTGEVLRDSIENDRINNVNRIISWI